MSQRDPSFDTLLELHGQTYVLADNNGDLYWVDFKVVQVVPSPERPHGLDYALNLHGPNSGKANDSRLVGFDNAHAIKSNGPAKIIMWDHKHRLSVVRVYNYTDPGKLMEDFWDAVAQIMKERDIDGW